MGLVNRSVASGQALAAATALAHEIAALPRGACATTGRASYEQWSLSMDHTLANETALGLATIMSGRDAGRSARFAAGEGRHGATAGGAE